MIDFISFLAGAFAVFLGHKLGDFFAWYTTRKAQKRLGIQPAKAPEKE